MLSSKQDDCTIMYHRLINHRLSRIKIQVRSRGGVRGVMWPPTKWPNPTRSQDNPRIIIKGPKIWPIWSPPQKSLATGLKFGQSIPTFCAHYLSLRHNWRHIIRAPASTVHHEGCKSGFVNSYSASHDNWCTATLWNRTMTAQCEGMAK